MENNIGARIKELRLERGLTQEELAEMLGYASVESVKFLESGRNSPSYDILIKLSKIFEPEIGYRAFRYDFGTRLRTLRRSLKHTQDSLMKELEPGAVNLGNCISRLEIETQSPSFKTLTRIINYADEHRVDFFGPDDPTEFRQLKIEKPTEPLQEKIS